MRSAAAGQPTHGVDGAVIGSRGFESHPKTYSTSNNSNGRGGIRTHAGVSPHDFQSCALSHSATRPGPLGVRDSGTPHHLHLPPRWHRAAVTLPGISTDGVGLSCGRLRRSSLASRVAIVAASRIPTPSLGSNPLCEFLRNSRGFESKQHIWYFNGRGGIRTHAGLPPTP